MGVIEHRKNMSLIVDAVNKLGDDSIYLIIVGWGEEAEVQALKALVADNPNIKLTGFVNDPIEYYQCADVFVSASYAEGLPNTVLEAMSSGLPSILSDIGPHREMLKYDTTAGVIFDHFDVKSLMSALERSLSWDTESASRRAREMIVSSLSKYCMAAKYAAVYQNALNQKR